MSKFVILLVVASLAVLITADNGGDSGSPDFYKTIMGDISKPMELAQDAMKDMANVPTNFFKSFSASSSTNKEMKNGEVTKDEHHSHVEKNDDGKLSVFDS